MGNELNITAIKGVTITPLKQIHGEFGSVFHALKANEDSFAALGEAYFSSVVKGAVKGWKQHTRMVSNLVVAVGAIKFVVYDPRPDSPTFGQIVETILSPDTHYARLTIQPGLWMGFAGVGEGLNLLLNLSSIMHDPTECNNVPIGSPEIPYTW